MDRKVSGWRGRAWSGGDLVLGDEADEDVASPEYPGAVGSRNGLRRVKVEVAMGASPGVVIDVLGGDRLQVASAEDQQVVEALSPDGVHPALRVRVRPRCQLLPMETVRPEPLR